ncbi:MAG: GNAT family N-acetyltransferase [Gemmatimonas sp.]|nr:GNAT family N-acetyltransferase [Gemmatimonas sp.]
MARISTGALIPAICRRWTASESVNTPYTMPTLPTLDTPRLRLRPFRADDAPALVRELGDVEVARETLSVPHPYAPERAQEFLARVAERFEAGKSVVWAIVESPTPEAEPPARSDGSTAALIGAVGLEIVAAHRRAELGYWIAKSRWGQGIATEAARAVVAYGFDTLGLHRIEAHHYPENPGSGAVMRKLGMKHEGRLRAKVWRDGVPRDLELYALLASDARG